jgi:cytochrome c biogenesis protein CcmG, thiol:disulfide interchange protein DsbE
MKTIKLTTVWVLLGIGCMLCAQSQKLPSIDLYTLDGVKIDASTISNENKPMVMVFWKTFDDKCCENLFMVFDSWRDKLEGEGVKLVAVCIDCNGRTQHVKPFVYGHNIDADIYIDRNGDFKRQMGITDGPFTIIFDQNMDIYCSQSGYCAGNGEILCEKVNHCLQEMASTK